MNSTLVRQANKAGTKDDRKNKVDCHQEKLNHLAWTNGLLELVIKKPQMSFLYVDKVTEIKQELSEPQRLLLLVVFQHEAAQRCPS